MRSLDQADLQRFAKKGFECGTDIAQGGQSNGLKVRRIIQILQDLGRGGNRPLRVLDLACGEGVYAIEAAIHGADVVAVDARMERMQHGIDCANRLKLDNLTFHQKDIRTIEPNTFGRFDVVLFLGILYHFDCDQLFSVLKKLYQLCDQTLIIDTLVTLDPNTECVWDGQRYYGSRHREHDDNDPPAVRQARLLRSIDNTFAFRMTLESLYTALSHVGFTSIYECRVPVEFDKAPDRVTLVAKKGVGVEVSTYPWVNGKTESEVIEFLTSGKTDSESTS